MSRSGAHQYRQASWHCLQCEPRGKNLSLYASLCRQGRMQAPSSSVSCPNFLAWDVLRETAPPFSLPWADNVCWQGTRDNTLVTQVGQRSTLGAHGCVQTLWETFSNQRVTLSVVPVHHHSWTLHEKSWLKKPPASGPTASQPSSMMLLSLPVTCFQSHVDSIWELCF